MSIFTLTCVVVRTCYVNIHFDVCSSSSRLCQEGMMPRTDVVNNKYKNAAYNWMAPELMAGDSPSVASDVYSICAVLWEIYNGMLYVIKEYLNNNLRKYLIYICK